MLAIAQRVTDFDPNKLIPIYRSEAPPQTKAGLSRKP
jgi:hypothetical protein